MLKNNTTFSPTVWHNETTNIFTNVTDTTEKDTMFGLVVILVIMFVFVICPVLMCSLHYNCYQTVPTSDDKLSQNDDVRFTVNEADFNRPTPFEQDRIFPSKESNTRITGTSLDLDTEGIQLIPMRINIANVKPVNRIKNV